MNKVYCFIQGTYHTDVVVVAVTVIDGKLHGIGRHISSNIDWAKKDIQQKYKMNYYEEFFKGEEFEMEWVEDPKNHPILKEF